MNFNVQRSKISPRFKLAQQIKYLIIGLYCFNVGTACSVSFSYAKGFELHARE